MKVFKRILFKIFIIALVTVLTVFDCVKVVAAEENWAIGSLNSVNYNDFSKLCKDLKNYKDKTLTIEMYCDWDCNKDSQFDNRIVIPENCKATLNMHGYMFNRDNVHNDHYSDNGELIYVDVGATLTINGYSTDEEKENEHTYVRVFSGIVQKYANNFIDTKGGTLAGGNSSGGPGAIYIDSGKEVVLNDVTIAGCKASYYQNPFVSYTGYGGGILITEDNTTLTMVNSTITGCLAQEDGGGIYAKDDDNIHITLDNSKVDKNYSMSDGGGINLDGENVSIYGKNGSSISGNKTKGYGGGVYFWNDDVSLTAKNYGDLVIDGNSAKYGGGVYLEEENNKLENLTITNNSASEEGGGVYVDNDNTTINNCTITGNKNRGVYITSDCDEGMYVTGSTIIKDNTGGNLTLTDDSSYLNFNQNDKAEIHIGYIDKPDSEGYTINKEPSADFSNQLYADDSGYVIVYSYHDNVKDNGRRLIYIKKSDVKDSYATRVNPVIVEIKTQDAHAYADEINRVYAGMYTQRDGVSSGTQYQLRTIYPRECTIGDGDFKMYYSDGLFFDNPIIYNDHLATASYGLATSGAYLNGYDYDYKHGAARQFMADIGCPDQRIYVNDNNVTKPGTDTIGVTIASKTLQEYDGDDLKNTDYTLVAIATRGANYEKEWASNLTLGTGDFNDGEAAGFSMAADDVMTALHEYIDIYDLADELAEGKVKFWISGFSRGGATANIVAKRVIEEYCYNTNEEATGNAVFAYPIEAPQGGTDKAETLQDKTKYYSIHNLVNTGDLVTYVGPKDMGFKRYGVDHYMPGTHLGKKTLEEYLNCIETKTIEPKGPSAASNITSVTTYWDNKPLSTKVEMDGKETDLYKEYRIRRDNAIQHLAGINHKNLFFDYFHPYGTDIYTPFFHKTGEFDGAKLEDYLANLFPFAQQETFYGTSYRETYVKKFQHLARAYYAEETDNKEKKLLDVLIKAIDKMIDTVTLTLIFNVLGDYYNLDDTGKTYVRNYLWETADRNGAFDSLTAGERKIVQDNWNIIADAVFNFTDGDWQLGYYGQGDPTFPETGKSWVNGSIGGYGRLADNLIYTFSLYKNGNMIINNNHNRDIGMAWARTYDNYYSDITDGDYAGRMKNDEYLEYEVHWVTDTYNPDNYSVAIPDAYVKENDTYTKFFEASGHEDEYNRVEPGQKILLEVGEIHEDVSPVNQTQGEGDVTGEAIYYKLYRDNQGLKPLLEKSIYRGGIDLPPSQEGDAYVITAYAISLGKESEVATYNIKVSTGHKVVIIDDPDGEPKEYSYHSGEKVTISTDPGDEYYFDEWSVDLLNEDGVFVSDITDVLLGSNKKNITATFTMPEDGAEYAEGRTYPDHYMLIIRAKCLSTIKQVETDFAVPEPEGAGLASKTEVTFDNGASKQTYQVVWTYTDEDGKTYPATDEVYVGVDYTATIIMPKDQANRIVFAPTDYLSAYFDGDPEKIKDVSITRNDADGSATLVIQFVTTQGQGPQPPEIVVDVLIKAFDLNLNAYIEGEEPVEYAVHPGDEITITAPQVTDEKFFMWDFSKAEGITPVGEAPDLSAKTIRIKIDESISGDPVIDAQYIPVLKNISAVIEVPEGGEPMQVLPDENTLKVTISNQYLIHPDYVNITWAPAPKQDGTADFLVNYTATISVVPKEDDEGKYIYVKTEGGEYTRIAAMFVYSEKVESKINNKAAQLDKNNNSISYTFPLTMCTVEEVYPPKDVTGIPYGASAQEVKEQLPTTVKMLLNDGRTVTTTVVWQTPEPELGPTDEYASKTWLASGKADLPYGVKAESEDQLNVVGRAIVDAAESVKRAVPSVGPGTYLKDQRVALVSETDDATIYWTTDPDKGDDYTTWNIYDGSEVEINRLDATEDELDPKGKPTGRKKITLRVYTYKDGMRPDGPRSYSYVFINEVLVPEGNDRTYNGREQVGVYGGDFYTLEAVSEGIVISENGDALAMQPGTYTVKAIVDPGFRWEKIDPVTGEHTYPEGDQEITFTIEDIPKKEFTVTLISNGGTLPQGQEQIKVTYLKPYGELPVPEKEDRSFEGWYTNDAFTTKISSEDLYEIDGDSSLYARYTYEVYFRQIDGVTSTGNAYDDINRVADPGKAPDKDGYAFDYWAKSSTEERFDFDNDETTPKMLLAGKYHRYAYDGNDLYWIIDDVGILSFRFVRYEHVFRDVLSDKDLKKLFEENNKQLFVDEDLLVEDSYTYQNGSLIIDLKGAYLNTLSTGKHSLTVKFKDGEASADFIVKERTRPSTPDYVIPKTGD